jgi:glycerol-3-phosphate O-acyltransferase
VFEWVDFLDLAEELAARPDDEAAARTAVSRAYYAAFHTGRDYLDRAEIPLDRVRNAHVQVQRELRKQSAQMGQDLELLHFWRKNADYDTQQFSNVNEQARSAVTLARETIDAIKALS